MLPGERKSFTRYGPILGKAAIPPNAEDIMLDQYRDAKRLVNRSRARDLRAAAQTFNPEVGAMVVEQLYDTLGKATKHDYGMKMAAKQAREKFGIEIPEDVMKYNIAPMLQPAQLKKYPIETMSAMRDATFFLNNPGNVQPELLRSELTYPELLDNFDMVNDVASHNFHNQLANLQNKANRLGLPPLNVLNP